MLKQQKTTIEKGGLTMSQNWGFILVLLVALSVMAVSTWKVFNTVADNAGRVHYQTVSDGDGNRFFIATTFTGGVHVYPIETRQTTTPPTRYAEASQ